MYRKEVNERSPLRILERSIHGGVGKGNLGVVMGRAGTGKTGFLVHVGLDDAMRERNVLHFALGQTLEHVQGWYDAIFSDLAEVTGLAERPQVRALIAKHRVIQAESSRQVTTERLRQVLALYEKNVGFRPGVMIIDGFDWEGAGPDCSTQIEGFRAIARELGAELWMSAHTHRDVTTEHPTSVTPPCAKCESLIEVAVFLEPVADHMTVRLLKDHDNRDVSETNLRLDPDTLRLSLDEAASAVKLPAGGYTLLSGGAGGAEQAFGEEAERFGVKELTYSFAGRTPARTRGLVELSAHELHAGEVSDAYVESHLHRKLPKTPTFQKTLQTIWHQVATAGEVFVIGVVQPDDTVNGGTGWAVELAKHFKKPVHVYDQERREWLRWNGRAWIQASTPRIQRRRFAGTGTRFLSDDGRAAIRQLFEASFGKPRS
ncbi:MAG: hypothetical protein AAB426_10995 [Myxococcota bacterium]